MPLAYHGSHLPERVDSPCSSRPGSGAWSRGEASPMPRDRRDLWPSPVRSVQRRMELFRSALSWGKFMTELNTWPPGLQPRLARITSSRISDRRIELHQRPLDPEGYP
jgi:hypothetical protein